MSKGIDAPLRVGLVGVGRAGWTMHCPEMDRFPEMFRITAAADPIPERLERMSQRYAGIKTYRTIEELVTDPNVDVVDIATPSTFHLAQASVALKAGKHVFLEKPIATTYDEAVALQKVAEQSAPAQLLIRHNRRFEPAFQHIREIIDAGLLGSVFEVKLRRHNYQRRDDWQAVVETGGGQLLNWGPHIIDHGLRLLDAPVADMWSDLKLIAGLGDAEDHLKIILRGTNGRVVDLEISGGVAIGEPVWTVYGDRGSLTCDERTITMKRLDPAKPLEPRKAHKGTPPMEGAFGDPNELKWVTEQFNVQPASGCNMNSIWQHLYGTLRQGQPFPIQLSQAVEVMRVVSAAKAGTRFQ